MAIKTRVFGWLICLYSIASGCTGTSLDNDVELFMDDMDTDGAADIAEDTGEDTGVLETARYFSIDGTITMEDSLVVLEETNLSIGFWTDKPELLCQASLDPIDATTNDHSELEQLLDSWSFEYDPSQLCKTTPDIPLVLGIGVMNDALNPVLDFENLDGNNLYGLYYIDITKTQTNTFIFGVAGTNAHYEGKKTPIIKGTLSDGTYTLLGLHLLPIPVKK